MSEQHEFDATDSDDDEKPSKRCRPAASQQYQEVRELLVSRHHAGEDWDSLAFSLALLPNLHGHHRVLTKLQKVLASPVFQTAEQWAHGAWIQNIPRWQRLVGDWEPVRDAIAKKATWLDPPLRRSGRDRSWSHPMRGHGMKVSPLASALVVRHAFENDPSATQEALALRFAHL